jgi:DNA-binding NtrC family response regulator
LYYRIAALRIELPPLRAHREDIPLLSERFLRSASERQKKRIRGFSAEALDVLERADWPGNVRELRNEVDRAVALASDGDEISAALLSRGIREPASFDGAPERVALSAPSAAGVPTPHAAPRPSDVKPNSTQSLFRCDGEFWTLSFAGQTALLKDVKGLRCIARLLREPYREFPALELAAEMEGASSSSGGRPAPRERDEPSTQIAASAGEGLAGLDSQAKSEYRRRLAELREQLDDAERDNDPGRIERAQAEIEFLTQQLSAAVGLAGRDRPSGSHAERARLLVTQRVKAALKKLAECHEPLAEHLSTAIKTGYRCSYSPDPEHKVDWQQ